MMNPESPASHDRRNGGPLLVVISAPSGGGKTTLCHQLLAADPGLTRAITSTTRPPRAGEEHGKDYYFLDPPTFANRVKAGEFLEHATVYGNQYGTGLSEVLGTLRARRDVVLSVDVQGVASIRVQAERNPGLKQALIAVFLAPPSMAVLEERLRKRGTDSEAVIQERLGVARTEIAESVSFDYLIISTTVAEDLRRMQVILEAERMRPRRVPPPVL
jgi:guanylate kinase